MGHLLASWSWQPWQPICESLAGRCWTKTLTADASPLCRGLWCCSLTSSKTSAPPAITRHPKEHRGCCVCGLQMAIARYLPQPCHPSGQEPCGPYSDCAATQVPPCPSLAQTFSFSAALQQHGPLPCLRVLHTHADSAPAGLPVSPPRSIVATLCPPTPYNPILTQPERAKFHPDSSMIRP